jgi:hypothetical protein
VENQEMDNLTLQHYINTYKQPLFKESMEAIETLTEVAEAKKKQKKDKKKDNRAPVQVCEGHA